MSVILLPILVTLATLTLRFLLADLRKKEL